MGNWQALETNPYLYVLLLLTLLSDSLHHCMGRNHGFNIISAYWLQWWQGEPIITKIIWGSQFDIGYPECNSALNCLKFKCFKLVSLDEDGKNFEINEFVDYLLVNGAQDASKATTLMLKCLPELILKQISIFSRMDTLYHLQKQWHKLPTQVRSHCLWTHAKVPNIKVFLQQVLIQQCAWNISFCQPAKTQRE